MKHRVTTTWRNRKNAEICKPRRGVSGEARAADILLSVFETPELWDIDFWFLSHSAWGILLWHPSKLIQFCCYNKAALTWWLKITQMNCVIFLQVRCPNVSPWAKIKLSVWLHSFLGTLGENLFLCLFLLLEATHILWSVVFFLPSSKSTNLASFWSFFHHHIIFSESPLPPSAALKDPCGWIGLTYIIQNNILILMSSEWAHCNHNSTCNLNFPLPYNIILFWEFRYGHLCEEGISLCTPVLIAKLLGCFSRGRSLKK